MQLSLSYLGLKKRERESSHLQRHAFEPRQSQAFESRQSHQKARPPTESADNELPGPIGRHEPGRAPDTPSHPVPHQRT